MIIWKFNPKYQEVNNQESAQTVAFVYSVLVWSHETWQVVIGHHPIYTSDINQGNTSGLFGQIAPLFTKYYIDFYLNGHVQKFDHLQQDGIDYMITSTGFKLRWTNPWFF